MPSARAAAVWLPPCEATLCSITSRVISSSVRPSMATPDCGADDVPRVIARCLARSSATALERM